ncbi:hypothetical protein Tco_0071311 [Tanacetum coccineum]
MENQTGKTLYNCWLPMETPHEEHSPSDQYLLTGFTNLQVVQIVLCIWTQEMITLVLLGFRENYVVGDRIGVELLKGSRGSNLYTISVEIHDESSLIYLYPKPSKNKSWLWHWRILNHWNSGAINDLAR